MERFDVVLVDLPRNEERVATLTSLGLTLGLDPRSTEELARNLPRTVRPNATSEEAEQLFHALRGLGAKLELRRSSDGTPAASGEAPAPEAPAKRAAAQRASQAAPRSSAATPRASAPTSRASAPTPRAQPAARVSQPRPDAIDLPEDFGVPTIGDSFDRSGYVSAIERASTESNASKDAIEIGELPNPLAGDQPKATFDDRAPVAKVGALAGRRSEPRSVGERAVDAAPPVLVPKANEPTLPTEPRPGWFNQRVVSCFGTPLRGAGVRWMIVIGVFGLLAILVSTGAAFIPRRLGLVVPAFLGSAFIGLNARFFKATFWAEAIGEKEPERMPELDPGFLLHDVAKPGFYLGAFQVVFQLAAAGHALLRHDESSLLFDPVMWLLVVFPLVYWPIGLTLFSLHGEPLSFLRVMRAIMIIARAPLPYLAVLFIGAIAAIVPVAALAMVATLDGHIALLLSPAMAGLPIAYAHGVVGASMGALFRQQPDLGDE